MEINTFKSDSLIFSTNQDKLEILKSLNQKSLFLNLTFFNVFNSFIETKPTYYFYLLENHNIKLDLANQIIKYLPYIDLAKEYKSKKLSNLQDILRSLLKDGIVSLTSFDKFQDKTVYSVNQMPIPSFINCQKIIEVSLEKKSSNTVSLKNVNTLLNASYCAYEEVVYLLNKGISINDIVILNTTSDDDYNLLKIFKDAQIPITINKAIKLNKYPEVISLQKVIKEKGYLASKEYLNTLVKSNKDSIYLPSLIRIYNSYLDTDLVKHPELLINLINNQTVHQKKYKNCLNVYSIDDFSYSRKKHYIIMNYTDTSLPKTSNNSHYLNDYELSAINYLSEIELNDYLTNHYTNLISQLSNLTLIFPRLKEEENRIASLELKREIIEEEYDYIIEDLTYLNSLTQLEFAKTKYDLKTFFLRHDNYRSLYKDYINVVRNYTHEFTGINQEDLYNLLTKNNSITPYKLESYTKCEFSFLLQNLLKLENFEENINQYLGNLSHRVLEEFTKNPDIDYLKIVDEFEGFPEDIKFKEKVFKTAIKKELVELLKVIASFHKTTLFKDIKPEIKFRFPFKHAPEFDISGIIDKVMVYKENDLIEYFILIDYKLSNKDFSLDKFNKNQQLQLPMYLYAYQNLHDNMVKPAGFFYQTTSLGRYKDEPNAILKNYRLKGLALEDKALLNAFNIDLENIEGINITSTGKLSSRTRLISEKNFQEIYDSIEQKVIDMIANLKKGEFKINPIKAFGSKKDSVSCEYCKFSAICYNKNRKTEVIS